MVATLRYTSTVAASFFFINIANYVFACNSIFDPDFSSTGHQPYGHDTYATIYNQYTVLASKIKITPNRLTGDRSITYGMGIEDTIPSSAVINWSERPTYKVISSGNTNSGLKPITLSWSRAKRFPHEDVYRALSAPFSANPVEIEVFNVVAEDPTGGSLGTVYFFVEIDYIVEMYELADLGSS